LNKLDRAIRSSPQAVTAIVSDIYMRALHTRCRGDLAMVQKGIDVLTQALEVHFAMYDSE
jgi:hypothetical protein